MTEIALNGKEEKTIAAIHSDFAAAGCADGRRWGAEEAGGRGAQAVDGGIHRRLAARVHRRPAAGYTGGRAEGMHRWATGGIRRRLAVRVHSPGLPRAAPKAALRPAAKQKSQK